MAQPVNIAAWLNKSRQSLWAAGIGTARLDCLVLLEDCVQKDRAYLLAYPETILTNEQQQTLAAQIKRRMTHEPLAYIRGKTEFYGRQFAVNKNVLEPRPESETMIGLLKSLPLPPGSAVIDVGTGSGALAITAKLEIPAVTVAAIDIDPKCISLAKKNAAALGVDITTFIGDLVEPIAQNIPLDYSLLCNLPYVPDSFHINQAASHEPRLAIFGGPDGLDAYRKLFTQLQGFESKPRYVLTEALPPQHEALRTIARKYGFTLYQTDDFIQVFAPGD